MFCLLKRSVSPLVKMNGRMASSCAPNRKCMKAIKLNWSFEIYTSRNLKTLSVRSGLSYLLLGL